MEENTFLAHLEALRKVILRSLIAVAVLFPVCWYLSGRLIPVFTSLLLPPEQATLHYFSPMEAFIAELKMAAILAFALAFPYVAWQFWTFITPALYKKEKKVLGKAVVFSSLLFIAGALFIFYVILPILMRFAFSFASELCTSCRMSKSVTRLRQRLWCAPLVNMTTLSCRPRASSHSPRGSSP